MTAARAVRAARSRAAARGRRAGGSRRATVLASTLPRAARDVDCPNERGAEVTLGRGRVPHDVLHGRGAGPLDGHRAAVDAASSAAGARRTLLVIGLIDRLPRARVRVRGDREPDAVLARSSGSCTPPSASAAATSRVSVPAEGNDEFAALGKEFNSMARQLEAPARGPPAGARPPAGGDPPRGRVVRARPGPRRRAGDRRADRGRRRRRRLRARHDAPARRRADGGGRPRPAIPRPTTARCTPPRRR